MSMRTYHMRDGEPSSRIPPFSLRLTKEERAELERRAGSMPLASYIKSVLFAGDAPTYRARRKPPVSDRKALADVLACLGASRLAANISQLAKAANIGDLYFDEGTKRDLNRASADIAAMRDMLMRALGYPSTPRLRGTDPNPPPKESVAQGFTRAAVPSLTDGKRFGI